EPSSTAPESLAVRPTLPASAAMLANLACVVVDEVHALAGNKRGADLALSLERLAALSSAGEVRRVGLSATATPLEEAARWLAGADRPCTIAPAAEAPAPAVEPEPLPQGGRVLASPVGPPGRGVARH